MVGASSSAAYGAGMTAEGPSAAGPAATTDPASLCTEPWLDVRDYWRDGDPSWQPAIERAVAALPATAGGTILFPRRCNAATGEIQYYEIHQPVRIIKDGVHLLGTGTGSSGQAPMLVATCLSSPSPWTTDQFGAAMIHVGGPHPEGRQSNTHGFRSTGWR